MKRTLAIIALLLAVTVGCRTPNAVKAASTRERPVVNVPLELRQHNWTVQGNGSCTWASLISLLRWQGRYNTADWVRQNCGGGEWSADMAKTLDGANVRYAYTTSGDVKFLEWACRTRRGCGITIMGGAHMVALVHLDDKWAALLDNNNVAEYRWVPRESLLAEWRASDGWAITPVYTPAAPLPQYE
jgi:hypothetical protein